MDYDHIVKGRRRNWDPLKPEEVRQREKEEERARREAERAAKGVGQTGFQKLRKRFLEANEAADKEEFRRAVLQAIVVLSVFFIAMGLWGVVSMLAAGRARDLFASRVDTYEEMIAANQRVHFLEDPLGAFSTWRSAWVRRDFQDLVNTFSETYLRKAIPNGDRSALVHDYLQVDARGGMEPSVSLAFNLGSPEPVRIPRKPWSKGELAIFRSQPVLQMGEEKRYIVALSFDSTSGTWRFADLREAPYFNVKWTNETQIAPLRVGLGATRYDEKGNQIRPAGE
jgi:hypothetical protein